MRNYNLSSRLNGKSSAMMIQLKTNIEKGLDCAVATLDPGKTKRDFEYMTGSKLELKKRGGGIYTALLSEPPNDNVNFRFDISRADFYEHDEPELKEKTKRRLTGIAECGREEVSVAEFGYKGIMSGLYIERVWGYSDEAFKEYMGWARELIQRSLKKTVR